MPKGIRATRRMSAAIVLAVSLGAPFAAHAEGDWIGVWSASPQPVWDADFFAPVGIPRSLRDQTIRQVARVSLGGEQVRVEFSNEYGDAAADDRRRARGTGRRRRRDRAGVDQAAHLRRRSRR